MGIQGTNVLTEFTKTASGGGKLSSIGADGLLKSSNLNISSELAPMASATASSGGGSALGSIFKNNNIGMWFKVASDIGGWINYGIQENKIKKQQRAFNEQQSTMYRNFTYNAYQDNNSIWNDQNGNQLVSGQSRLGCDNAAAAAQYRSDNASLFS